MSAGCQSTPECPRSLLEGSQASVIGPAGSVREGMSCTPVHRPPHPSAWRQGSLTAGPRLHPLLAGEAADPEGQRAGLSPHGRPCRVLSIPPTFQELCRSTLADMEKQEQRCRPLICEKSKPVPLKLFTPRLVRVCVSASRPHIGRCPGGGEAGGLEL